VREELRVAVEEWLDSIKRAKGTRAKIRNIMSAIFHHAMRYEWVERNPIKLVRQNAKRERTPDILELAKLQLLLSKLAVRERTLALLDAATGLRVSEPIRSGLARCGKYGYSAFPNSPLVSAGEPMESRDDRRKASERIIQ
jgi:site-specific recombinase XerD